MAKMEVAIVAALIPQNALRAKIASYSLEVAAIITAVTLMYTLCR